MTPEQSLAVLARQWRQETVTLVPIGSESDWWNYTLLDKEPPPTPAELKERGFPEPTE